jgi:hypothetical protein
VPAKAPITTWPLERVGLWVYQVCIDFGAQPETAHQVAAVFVAGLRKEGCDA